MPKQNVYKIIKYVTAFFSIIMIICFFIQLARIYFGGLKPLYSRDLVSSYLLQILPVIILWCICVITGLIFSLLIAEKKRLFVKTTNEARLQILEANLPQNINDSVDYQLLLKSHRKIKIARIISGVIYAICLIMVSLYLFNPSHFINEGNINGQIIKMFINIGPWIIVSFITLCIYTYYINFISKTAITYCKNIIKANGKVKKEYITYRHKLLILNILRVCIIVIAICMITFGVFAGEPQRVYQKAINICTECIGLG